MSYGLAVGFVDSQRVAVLERVAVCVRICKRGRLRKRQCESGSDADVTGKRHRHVVRVFVWLRDDIIARIALRFWERLRFLVAYGLHNANRQPCALFALRDADAKCRRDASSDCHAECQQLCIEVRVWQREPRSEQLSRR